MAWLLALLLKPLFVVGFVYAYYLIVYRGSLWLGRFITNPSLFDFLFRERGCFDARHGLPATQSRRGGVGAQSRRTNKRLLQ